MKGRRKIEETQNKQHSITMHSIQENLTVIKWLARRACKDVPFCSRKEYTALKKKKKSTGLFL